MQNHLLPTKQRLLLCVMFLLGFNYASASNSNWNILLQDSYTDTEKTFNKVYLTEEHPKKPIAALVLLHNSPAATETSATKKSNRLDFINASHAPKEIKQSFTLQKDIHLTENSALNSVIYSSGVGATTHIQQQVSLGGHVLTLHQNGASHANQSANYVGYR